MPQGWLSDTASMIVVIGGIAAAISGIWVLIEKIHSKSSVGNLEGRMSKVEEYLSKDNERLKTLEKYKDMQQLEMNDMHETARLTLNAVRELLKSQLNGDNAEGMKEASDDIEKYLSKKI